MREVRGSEREREWSASFGRDPGPYVVAAVAVAVCAPFLRWLAWLGDEGVVLHAAVRILDGHVLYRDFFEFLPPGSFVLVSLWMTFFGASFASARVLAISTIVIIAVLLYVAARRASDNRPLAALLAAAWIVLSQGAWTVISHHWFTTAVSMGAAVALLVVPVAERPLRAAFVAGVCAGAAAMLTTTRGALVALAVLLALPKTRTHQASALVGMAVLPAVLGVYLAAHGALGAGIDDAIRFPAGHYAQIQVVPFARGGTLATAAAVAFFPMSFLLAAGACAVGGLATWRDPRFRASLALASAGLLGAYPRPDIDHINFAVPLACPLFALATTTVLARLERRVRAAASVLLVGVWALGTGPALARIVAAAAAPHREVPTLRGPVVRRQGPWVDDLAGLLARVDDLPPGDTVFFYPYSPMLPYLTGRRHVATFDVMTPGYTTAEQYRDTCRRVVDHARWVVIERMWLDPRILHNVFPAMREPNPPERYGFEAVLGLAFGQVVHTSTYFELRRRTRGPGDALCEQIGSRPR